MAELDASSKKIHGDKLKKFLEQTMVCTSCGYCKSVCPAFGVTLWDSNTARSKIMLAYGLITGEVEPDESVIQSIFECSTCADCKRRCPSKVETLEIIMATRQELAELGLIPDNLKISTDNINNFGNPQGDPKEKRTEFVPDDVKAKIGKGADVLVFLGCSTSYTDMKSVSNIFKILNKAGVDYAYLGEEEPCCGLLNWLTGYPSKSFGENIKKAMDSLNPRPTTIITPCPGCYRSFEELYPEAGVDLGVKAKHILEFISELIEKGQLKVTGKLDGTVLFQDPCDLGRHIGMYEEPRQLLSHFVELTEFEYNRDKAHCCGGGGGLQATNYELTSDIAKNRMKEAVDLEADIVVTACPSCKATLSNAAVDLKKEIGKKIKIKDLLDIVAKNTAGPTG
jgi:glycolate oxidase